MTKEECYYWRLWNEIYKKFSIKTKEDKESLRKDITTQALDIEKSHKLFSHSDYDIVLNAMRQLLNTGECVSTPWTRAESSLEGERKRYIYKINQTASEAYICAVSKDKFKTYQWEGLTIKSLKMLLSTLTRAKFRKHKKELLATITT